MPKAQLHLHPRLHRGAVDRRIFGGFLEHMGRAVYEGVYDPTSAFADEYGCRADVLDALRALDFTIMRYPGGNFVSNYHWLDGVGPAEARPTRRELAWGTIEPNQFGTDEFLALAERMGWEPMLAVNLGTGTPEEAADWVEYCNATTPTTYAELRSQHGRTQPWKVPLWCLGNEMDGPWQVGHMPAADYGIKARQAGHMMRLVDPSIELVVCGTSVPTNPTYLEWDREALSAVGGLASLLSTHLYVGNPDDNTTSYLATGVTIDRHIDNADAVCRYVAGTRSSGRRHHLAFDEWNVWYRTQNAEGMQRGGEFPMPLIEEVYDLQDALVVAQFLMSFIRHADVVKVANLAQITNVIAPILTRVDGLLRQTIFEALEMFVGRRDGVSLLLGLEGPQVAVAGLGEVPAVDAAAILGDSAVHVFLVNRHTDDTIDVDVELAGAELGPARAELLHHDDPRATNTWQAPDTVRQTPLEVRPNTTGGVNVPLPPASFAALTVPVA